MRRNTNPPKKTASRSAPRSTWAANATSASEHRRTTALCGSMSLLTGTAIGAALMYIFDPDAGQRRRQAAMDAAGGAIGSASHSASDFYHSAADSVGHALQHLGENVSSGTRAAMASIPSASAASEAAHGLLGRAADSAAGYRDMASERAHGWIDSARSMIPQRRRPTDVSATSATALGLGALALGLGAMWLFDPSRGRARRAWIGQKANRVVNETGQFMNATGRHLRNRSKGVYHDASGYVTDAAESITDSQLAERVRATIGRLGDVASQIRVDASEGRIHLTGKCVTDIVNQILDAVRGTPGVRGIDNSLDVSDMYTMGDRPNSTKASA